MDEYISKEAVLKYLNECKEDPLFDPDMARICFAISIFIEEMQAADVQSLNQWISVKDRLPDATEATVLIWIKEGKADGIEISDCCHIGYWVKNSKEFCDMDWNVVSGITHWMPLPEPPKDGDAE